jgi:hypothetical protein
VLRRLAQVIHFGHDREGGTITAAVPLTARLLTPWAGTGRLGAASMVRTCGLLALGAVETLVEVADRGLQRCHLRLQGHFALHKPRVLRLPVIRLPLERDRGLLCQHHALLGKGSGVVAVTRRQIRDGVDIGVSALHGERYTRFFWNVLVFMMGVLGSPKLYQQIIKQSEEPSDLAGTVVFLASEDSDFITGQTINVHGGATHH